MSLSNMEYGKAFEYACLISLRNHLVAITNDPIVIVMSDAFRTARNAFDQATLEGIDENLMDGANAASRVLTMLEPKLSRGGGTLSLSIQTDAKGIAGDVRDVVCVKSSLGWEVGISCKHNHYALKHSRLSETIDFGQEWFGVPCSRNYFAEIIPIFEELRELRDITPTPLWRDIPDKDDRYYIPILNAFLREMIRLDSDNKGIPEKLINYMIGRYDFYKVITDDRHRTTRIEAMNLSGSLNQPAGGYKSIVNVPKLKFPTRFYHMGFVPGSNNKIEIVCDEGWTLTMRIHNASSRVEPSLKFDVQLVSLPASVYAQVEPW